MKQTPNTFQCFSEIKDYRRMGDNTLHNFTDILVIALCGIISGADDWVSIEEYANEKIEWFKTFLPLRNGIPSHDTFNRVFARINPEHFMQCFLASVDSLEFRPNDEVVAIDGKTLRRSHDKADGKQAIHMVSAWATENKLVLGQVKTANKSNEITAIPELLQILAIEGCLVTIDAMGCQKDIAKSIVDKGANYLLAVKGNQPKLLEAIQATLDQRSPKAYKNPGIDYFETEVNSRNRNEIRRCWVTQSLGKLSMTDDWVGINSIAMLESQRTVNGKTSIERRYYICSESATAERILAASRAHWGIENSLHWVLDMAFREDENRNRKGYSAENLARLRHYALNLLKQDKRTKIGIKNKRLKAGWSNTYLLQILNGELSDG